MHEVKVYDSSGNLKKVISVKALTKRSDQQIQSPPYITRKGVRPNLWARLMIRNSRSLQQDNLIGYHSFHISFLHRESLFHCTPYRRLSSQVQSAIWVTTASTNNLTVNASSLESLEKIYPFFMVNPTLLLIQYCHAFENSIDQYALRVSYLPIHPVGNPLDLAENPRLRG